MDFRQNCYHNDYNQEEKFYQKGRQHSSNYNYSTYPEDCCYDGKFFEDYDTQYKDWSDKNSYHNECHCPKCRNERNDKQERKCPKYDCEERWNKKYYPETNSNHECENINNNKRNCGFCGFFRIFRCK